MKISRAFITWPRRLLSAAALLLTLAVARAQTAPPATSATTAPPVASAARAAPGDYNPPAAVAAVAPAVPSLFVCGDSTAKNNDKTRTDPPRQMQGWGTPIANYFDPAKVKINNVGHAGTSSHTYYNGDWPRVLPQIKPGDYVLEVFGINDGTTPNGLGNDVNAQGVHTYGWYMSKMATDAQAQGAHVYLLTVTARDIWTNPKATFTDATIKTQQDGYDPKDDRIERGTGNGRYTQWTKDVGAQLHIPVLDLTNLEADVYEKTGREKVMVNYTDHNHTDVAGADIVARIIVSGLKAFKNSPFTAMLSDKGTAVETADAKYVTENSTMDKPAAPAVTSSANPTAPAPATGSVATPAK